MAFPDDAGLKGYSVVENPVSVLENTHRVIGYLFIQAEIDRLSHSLEIGQRSMVISALDNKILSCFTLNI